MKIIVEEKGKLRQGVSYWIKADGHVFEVEPDNGVTFSLEELQAAVGGFIEVINVPWHHYMKRRHPDYVSRMIVCNEEGKIRCLPLNDKASDLAFDQIQYWDFICGDVLFIDSDKME